MQVIQIILALSILVLIHELGHYTFARIFGIRIDKFFLFFDAGGVKLFSTRSEWFLKICPKAAEWETEYGIGWLPLGGYCKVNGMIDESMDTEFMKSEPKPWEFRSKPAWQRLLVMVGGVLFNFILGIALFSFSLFQWGENYVPAEGINIYVHENSLEDKIGFKSGDIILALDGEKPGDFRMVQVDMARNKVEKVTVARNGDTLDLYIDHNYIADMLNTPMFREIAIPFVIDEIPKESHNANVGLTKGDKIIAINETPITYLQDAVPVLKELTNQEINITFLRDSTKLSLPVTVDEKGTIGVACQIPHVNVQQIRYSFLESIPAGLRKAYDATIGQIKDLLLLAQPSTGAYKSVGSIIAITEVMPQQWNWAFFINILATISIILAVMNLLPIPALDGGHIVFVLYEMITGRKPSDKFLAIMQIIGMILIFGLMFLAFGNDIARLIK